jgi:hypothetical protein
LLTRVFKIQDGLLIPALVVIAVRLCKAKKAIIALPNIKIEPIKNGAPGKFTGAEGLVK